MKRNVQRMLVFALVAGLGSSATLLSAQAPSDAENSVQGPPEWVLQAWQTGERPERSNFGPPEWVLQRHAYAAELGLPGPPLEVLDAWQNGLGFELPGPPSFVIDLLQLGDRQSRE